ncbi:MAG: PD40 domain-containing protein [Dehalococcoidia bacterium]|nr:PD40 domain-containing protein [Dehalococcoidia bacterium]
MGSARFAPRRGHAPYWLITVAVFAAVAAVVPIVAAIIGDAPAHGARTAFADAPAGTYAVFARPEATADVIMVAPATSPGEATEVVRVPHLPGFMSSGAVSPDGRRVALVTVDAGTPARPGASLLVADLDSGALDRLAVAVDPLQTPLWTPDGQAVVVTRNTVAESGLSTVTFVRVTLAGSREAVLFQNENVLGAYAIGFDPAGRLVSVVIDGRGSTVARDGTEGGLLSTQITRDWRLSPDGTRLAYVESDVTAGLHYRAQVAALDGGGAGDAQAQAAGGAGQQMGVAWAPGAAAPLFGREPEAVAPGAVAAQAAAAGFDIPLAYAPGGGALAVQHWSGSSFAEPGRMEIAVVGERAPGILPGAARFYGWAAR